MSHYPRGLSYEISYLRSAMSYTNSKTLADYKESQWICINGITYNK